jgi:transposase
MDVVYKKCCGLDVHKKIIVACIIDGTKKEVKTFGAMTEDILALVDWIKSTDCEAVAMESTGVYWKPIYNLLELENMTTLVVNAKHMKAVPGRKTDVKDSEWIAQLLKHGLLRASFIPSREQRELRELVRYRRSITEERAREVTRIQKILEGANIKLASVASNIMGVSGRNMLNAIVNGNIDPVSLSQMAKAALRGKIPELQQALTGLIGEHQKMILKSQLSHIDFLDSHIEELSREVARRLESDNEIIEILDTIPGINRKAAELIVAEIGTDMSRFPSDSHIASWAGLCPGNNESAGKKKNSSTHDGNKHIRAVMVEAALANRNAKSYFASQYKRIAARRGKKRAAIAVAHSMLIVVYHMISKRQPYQELGQDYFDKLNSQYRAKKLIKQLESLGYTVTKEQAIA